MREMQSFLPNLEEKIFSCFIPQISVREKVYTFYPTLKKNKRSFDRDKEIDTFLSFGTLLSQHVSLKDHTKNELHIQSLRKQMKFLTILILYSLEMMHIFNC